MVPVVPVEEYSDSIIEEESDDSAEVDIDSLTIDDFQDNLEIDDFNDEH